MHELCCLSRINWRPLDSKTRTRFDLKFFRVFSNCIDFPENFILPFLTRKFSTVIFSEGGYAPSRSQNDKTLISRFRHHDIVAKTRSRMTRTITFSRQNDAASSARTTYYLENPVLVVVLVLESKDLY